LDEQFDVIDDHDGAIFQYININNPSQGSDRQISFSEKVSNYMGDLCSRPMAVLFSFMVVIALIGIASGMHWTATGQLLCNTPTMIIEGFLLIVLLHAHNMSNTTRRFQMHDILLRRLKLMQYVRAFSNGESDVLNEKQVQDCSDLTINKK
jgi:low-affinity ferrous iron transport protein